MNREQTNAHFTRRAARTTPLTDAEYRSVTDDDHTARLLPGEPDPQWATKHDATEPPPVVQFGQGRDNPDLGEPWKWPVRMAAWFGVRLAFAYAVMQLCIAAGGGR